MNLVLPLNFGERPCDRLLLRRLRADLPYGEMMSVVLWMAFTIWKDFAIARDDRRTVPVDPEARAKCETVAILEAYCGWRGAPGGFVEAGIGAGFFELVALDEVQADLVLVDFFPANHSSSRGISNSKLGGIAKGMNKARERAMQDVSEQLTFFERQSNPLLETIGKDSVADALFLVHQICRILGRKPPVAREWKESLIELALEVLKQHAKEDLELAFKWLANNRDSQKIPPRMDFILKQFSEFITYGRKEFV